MWIKWKWENIPSFVLPEMYDVLKWRPSHSTSPQVQHQVLGVRKKMGLHTLICSWESHWYVHFWFCQCVWWKLLRLCTFICLCLLQGVCSNSVPPVFIIDLPEGSSISKAFIRIYKPHSSHRETPHSHTKFKAFPNRFCFCIIPTQWKNHAISVRKMFFNAAIF